jgi:FtsP/CotA-like multicopper oxidase with cupredoxin domain
MSLLARLSSRRRFLAGAGISLTGLGLTARSEAETVLDGFQVLRAGVAAAATRAQSTTWSYERTVPGPTLRRKRGEELRVRLANELAEPTSIHWHGVRLPSAMDGVPGLTQAPVRAGGSFDYRFRVPDAGTFWYHAHSLGQIDRGLYGALIVEEAQPVDVDRDILLLFGTPAEHGDSHPAGFVLVNGKVNPDIAVKAGERLRLRLINATGARGLSLRIEGHPLWVMAIDGQPAEPFRPRAGRLALGPGSRADLFLDTMQQSQTIVPILSGVRDTHPIARLVYDGTGNARAAPRSDPLPLPGNPLPGRIDLKNSLKIALTLGAVPPFDPAGPPLFTVRRGRAVTLAIRNPTGEPQVVHLHGHHFRLLDRLDDGWKPFWLDTLVIDEAIERIAFVADNPGKWLIRAQRLEHPDSDTAVWFGVS